MRAGVLERTPWPAYFFLSPMKFFPVDSYFSLCLCFFADFDLFLGGDATADFDGVFHSTSAQSIMKKHQIGWIEVRSLPIYL